jgi:hypothetical protein
VDFHGAHSRFGSASHSGLGSDPAMVVGKSMTGVPSGLKCVMATLKHFPAKSNPVGFAEYARAKSARGQIRVC